MPYNTHWEAHGILWTFHGDVTAQEIAEANDDFYSDERSDRAAYQIIDASEVDHVEWSDRNITETAAHDIGAARVIKNLKVAYVARDEEIISKMEKYIDIARQQNASWQFEGFQDIRRARAWIRGDTDWRGTIAALGKRRPRF